MMDDIQEQTELADEISRAISEPAGFGMEVDEVSTKHYAGCKMYISRHFLISNSSSKVNSGIQNHHYWFFFLLCSSISADCPMGKIGLKSEIMQEFQSIANC